MVAVPSLCWQRWQFCRYLLFDLSKELWPGEPATKIAYNAITALVFGIGALFWTRTGFLAKLGSGALFALYQSLRWLRQPLRL